MLDVVTLTWIAVATFLAAILRSFTGFGFALAAVPVFSLVLLPADAVVLGSSLAFALGIVSLRHYWGVVAWKDLWPMLLASVLGTALGVNFLAGVSVRGFQICMGLTIIATCIVLTQFKSPKGRASKQLGGAVGLASGLMNGAMAIPGPPVIVYALYAESEPVKSRALMMAFFCVSAAIAMSTFAAGGMVRSQTLAMALFAIPMLYLGDQCGARLFDRYGEQVYRRAAVLLLFLLGLAITGRGLF